jgi:hypothetical protein
MQPNRLSPARDDRFGSSRANCVLWSGRSTNRLVPPWTAGGYREARACRPTLRVAAAPRRVANGLTGIGCVPLEELRGAERRAPLDPQQVANAHRCIGDLDAQLAGARGSRFRAIRHLQHVVGSRWPPWTMLGAGLRNISRRPLILDPSFHYLRIRAAPGVQNTTPRKLEFDDQRGWRHRCFAHRPTPPILAAQPKRAGLSDGHGSKGGADEAKSRSAP